MTDLFTTPELIPEELKIVLSQQPETHEELNNVIAECNQLGYTFDYDLHCEVYNIRKINNND